VRSKGIDLAGKLRAKRVAKNLITENAGRDRSRHDNNRIEA